MLKDKAVYSKIILFAIPLTAVCSTALSSVIAGVIALCAVLSAWALVSLLKQFLTSKTAPFVRIVIALGVIGILTMVLNLFFKSEIEGIALYLPIISVTTVMLLNIDDNLQMASVSALKLGSVLGAASSVFIIVVGILKEFLGSGSFFGLDVYTRMFAPIEFFKTPAGALFISAVLTIGINLFVKQKEKGDAK